MIVDKYYIKENSIFIYWSTLIHKTQTKNNKEDDCARKSEGLAIRIALLSDLCILNKKYYHNKKIYI